MFCSKCGKEINDEAVVCIHCGCQVKSVEEVKKNEDKPSFWFALAGFLIPLVGLILYFVLRKNEPKRAKSAGKGALIGFIVNLVVTIITTILLVMLMVGTFDNVFDNHAAYSVSEDAWTDDCSVEFGSFTVEQGSYYSDTHVDVKITNKTGSMKSFMVTVEAVNADGDRLDTDVVYVYDLGAGQSITLEAFEYIAEEDINAFKKAEFKVLKVD